MKTLDVGSGGPIADYVREAADEPVVFTIGGKPVAALVPMRNTDAETASLSTNSEFLATIERSRTRLNSEAGITTEAMRTRLGLE